MPTATPVPLIKPANRLFASIDIDTVNYVFKAQQLPSTYYMTDNGPFIRLRPLHSDGFGIFEKATRVVALYTGNWDQNANFSQNLLNNRDILYFNLGQSAAEIAHRIVQLRANSATTEDVKNHNNSPNKPILQNTVVFVGEGALAGTAWGCDAQKTNNLFEPLDVVDATQLDSYAHTGHSFVTNEAAQRFYADQYPNLLEQLMLLGQSQQSFAIDLAPKGRRLPVVVQSELQYFPQDMFASRAQQLDFLRALYMSFV